MKMRSAALVLAALTLAVPPLSAQSAPPNFLEEFSGQFEASARKMVALAEAMPADRYSWQPAAGVLSVVHVYMHIANYNYMYPHQVLGISPGAGAEYDSWEETVTDKAQAVQLLTESMDHVRSVVADMTAADLEKPAVLYGRDVAQWAVLLQLVTHMNEHLGQSIAYARMNGVTPPWSN
jgi:uncharacterized damage-inducible protein DinB